MKPTYEFRKLRLNELDSGYAVHLEAYEWLKSRGSKQWVQPFPNQKYRAWHQQRLNYGFFSNQKLTTVLSLVRKKGFGRLAIQAAVRRMVLEQRRPLFLHCYKGSGFLPEYYSRLGFKTLSETELDNGPWTLMKHPVQSEPES